MSIPVYSAASFFNSFGISSANGQNAVPGIQKRQVASVDPAIFADRVTISQESRDAFEASGAAASETSISENHLSKIAHSLSPTEAAAFVKTMAYTQTGPLVSLDGPPGSTGPWKYAATGEPVTEESKSYFNEVESKAQSGRIALYEAEVAKGTSPAEIMDKIIAYQRTQPLRYREALGGGMGG